MAFCTVLSLHHAEKKKAFGSPNDDGHQDSNFAYIIFQKLSKNQQKNPLES